MSYILLTPILNEAKSIGQLKETVLGQTLRPLIWVIGDGKSVDNSFEIATDLFKGYDWVHVIRQKTFTGDGYSHKNFANNVNDCYRFAMQLCESQGIEYDYVGKTDAIPVLSPGYFEALHQEMEEDRSLAFTCGAQYLRYDRTTSAACDPDRYVHTRWYNDIRLYRKEFIEEMGGYPVSASPDSVLTIKALKRGWHVKIVEKTRFIKSRVGGSKIGFWSGYKLKGHGMYTLGYNPVLVLLNSLYLSRSYPYYSGLAVLCGYLTALARGEEKISDNEVIEYFWKTRLQQIAKGIFYEGKI